MKTSEAPLRPACDRMLWSCIITIALLACGIATPLAHADDKDDSTPGEVPMKERIATLQKSWKTAKSKKDINTMRGLLDGVSDLYEDCRDDADLQLAIIRFTGGAAKGTSGSEFKILALETIAALGDPRGARYIKPYLRQANPKKASETLLAAIAAAEELPDPSLVAPLLKIVTKTKTTKPLRPAVEALGKQREAGKKRYKILTTLVSEARKVKPGPRPRMRGTQEQLSGGSSPYGRESGPGARWATLSASVPAALRTLTGHDVRNLGEWMALVKNHKGKYGELFVAE